MANEKATIITLAQATGLSLATVSRALAGSTKVLPETREKVLKAAEAMNYVRDRTAVRLKTGKTYVVAFIMDRYDSSQPGFKELLLGLSQAMSNTDYQLFVIPESENNQALDAIRYVVEKGMADGVIISHTSPQDERVAYLQSRQFPFITHGRTHATQQHAYVDFANEAFAQLCVQSLKARQRKKPAIIVPTQDSTYSGHLSQGFLSACQEQGIEGVCINNISMDDDPETLYQWTINNIQHFDSLIITREAPVLPILSAINDCGLSIGTDIDVAIKYSSHLPRYIRSPLMACYEDLHLTGLSLGKSLLKQLTQVNSAPEQILFAPPSFEFLHKT